MVKEAQDKKIKKETVEKKSVDKKVAAKKTVEKRIDRFQATGRRKSAVARVALFAGSGKLIVNKKPIETYFNRETHRLKIMQPFDVTNTTGKFNVRVSVNGGGETGQADAIRHGISRALIIADIAHRAALKSGGFLTRDSRMKERKKYGQKRARKKFQYSKR